MTTPTPYTFAIEGGLDLVTSALQIPPGRAIAAFNYEPTLVGYRRIDGYERADGQLAPSQATYYLVGFENGTAAIAQGDTVTGATSGASGVALYDATVTSGSYAGSDAAGYLILTAVSGTFTSMEDLQVSAVTKATETSATERGAGDDTDDKTYLQAAIEYARGLISTVPGGGRIRGVWNYNGVLYAFRDDDADSPTKCRMYKSTSSGWSLVSLGYSLPFTSGGTYVISEGDTITGHTSGATATVERIQVLSGNFATGDAAGFIYFSSQTGNFGFETLDVGTNTNVATTALYFTSGGTYEMAVGDTVTGATSSATATIAAIQLISGSFAGGDAVGFIFFTTSSGTFSAENLNVGSNSNVATLTLDSIANEFLPSGNFEFVTYNFYGASNLVRMYGCDGVNRAFEFDGTTFAWVSTGMAADTPDHITAHKNHLFLSFPGGSIQFSGTGTPLVWDVVLGAGEIGIGQDCTGFVSAMSGVLGIFGRTAINVLYGSSTDDWQLVPFANDAGAMEGTCQKINDAIYMDDRGVRSLSTTQAYGDFKSGTYTLLIAPLLETKRKAGVRPCASVRVRSKDQYRLFYDDGTGFTIYFGKKTPEILPFDLGKIVRCICSCEDENGDEVLYFGSDDGYVYQLDSGTSFDGSEVDAYVRLAFCNSGTPRQNKRYRELLVETDAAADCTLSLTADFSYGKPEQPSVSAEDLVVPGGGGFWGESNWSEFNWDTQAKGIAQAYIDGIGTNISLTIASASVYDEPHTLQTATILHTPRGLAK